METQIPTLIVDDHAIVRQGLRMMLEAQPHMEVVGEAADVAAAVGMVRKFAPALVLLDLLMPGMSAVEGIQQIRQISVNTRILVLSSSTEDQLIKGALEAGAHGYILKASRPAALLEAIEKVMSGVYALDPLASEILVRGVRQHDPITSLTTRERDVFDLMARGQSNSEIAQTLVVSEGTVRTHIANVLDKLSLRDRTQVTIYALKRGLIRVEDLP
ncbi:MAG: response regulator transcription factor [Chloroflexota bacterium]|nr:response regulator transcription factor [Chloroflexota bacterium]